MHQVDQQAPSSSISPRVLFVSHTGTMSGAEYVLASLTEGWKNAAAIVFEDGPLPEALRRNGLNVKVAGEMSLKDLHRSGSLSKVLSLVGPLFRLVSAVSRASRQCDVIYANSQKAFLLSALANSMRRKPLVWHLHDILDKNHFGAVQRRLQVTLANMFASFVVVPSKAAGDAFVANGGRRALVQIIPNGVSSAATIHIDRQGYRSQQGLPSGPLVGVFSRIAPWKGQHIVIEAMARLPGVGCIIAGSALFGEDAYLAQLAARIQQLGLADRVFLIGQRNDVPQLMQAVDIVVHPSVDPEPFGLTLVEAMLARTPVIATRGGAAMEILEDGKAGDVVDPGSVDDLVNTIKSLLGDESGNEDRLSYAKLRAETVYDVGLMRAQIMSLISRLAPVGGI